MEHENQFAIINDNTVQDATTATEKRMKRKRKSGLSFFNAAMFMLRSSNNKKKSEKQFPPCAAADMDTANPLSPHKWQRIVGSMRPFTLQEDGFPVPRYEQQEFPDYHHQRMRSSPSMDSFEDAMIPPYSPSCTSLPSSGTVSQYASANNLYAMDEHNGEGEENDGAFDNKPADDMIDEKAEQFIAHFHAQMRSQHFDGDNGVWES